MDKTQITFLIINIFIIGLSLWIIKFNLEKLIKGNNFDLERITRKELKETINELIEDFTEKIEKLENQIKELNNEIITLKIILAKIENYVENHLENFK